MQWSASLRVFLLLLMVGCESIYSAGNINCKIPPFDRRRCYQVYTSNPHLNYSDASTACRATQQRLASMETEQLVMFVKANIQFQLIWIGLSRTSDGQPDVWTSGKQLQASLYPSVTLSVNRGSQDVGKLCSLILNGSTVTFINTLCSGTADRLCETFRSNVFQVRPIGHVVNDVSEGQLVNSDIPISIFDCIRKCWENWTCEAIGHDGVTCLLHFQQAGHKVNVTSARVVYTRMK
ncbi:uncharacterized protein LOC112562967 [Pomacea canaliculata]|uniref:uncharacterized protein LOC112562967 n=1 Tax=Pomacea canaliculata TaxID=400727 RepID=UPI000D730B4B|nr:uncharacterized protein LOC112562967 [Pomacea canaliculata]